MPITDIGLVKQYIIVSNKFINYLHILFDKPYLFKKMPRITMVRGVLYSPGFELRTFPVLNNSAAFFAAFKRSSSFL